MVFHLDEENGGRPAEAAYLSRLKEGDRGVKEVIVFTSYVPQRVRVYLHTLQAWKYSDKASGVCWDETCTRRAPAHRGKRPKCLSYAQYDGRRRLGRE